MEKQDVCKKITATFGISPVVLPRIRHQEVFHLGLEEVATVALFEAQRLEPALIKARSWTPPWACFLQARRGAKTEQGLTAACSTLRLRLTVARDDYN